MAKKIPKFTLLFFVLVFLGLLGYSYTQKRVWMWDTLLALFLITGSYFFSKRLQLTKITFTMLGIGLLLHNLGVFGFYNKTFFSVDYDHYVHFWNGLTLAIILSVYLAFQIPKLKLFTLLFLTFFVVLGLSALHELAEFGAYRLFGYGEGFFLLGPGDIGASGTYENTMLDMFNNLLGAVAGLVIIAIKKVKS